MKFKFLLMVPLLAASLQAATVDDLTFTLIRDGSEYSVSDCQETASGSLIIPSAYNGLPVTSIGDAAFKNCSSLVSITIPDGVTSIGQSAFYRCSSLTSITIPDGVISIGDDAFNGCGSLYNITIPDGVTSIGNFAFHYCGSLTSITIPASVTSIGRSIVANYSNLEKVVFEGKVPDGLIDYDFVLSSTTIVYCYEWYADGYLDVINIYNSNTLQFIDVDYDGDGLGDIWENNYFGNLDQDGTDDYDADGYTNAEEHESESDPSSVYSNQFYDLFTFILTEDGTSYRIADFNNLANLVFNIVTDLDIPNTFNGLPVTTIGSSAFSNCSSLTGVRIPSSVTSIEGYHPLYPLNGAFYNCRSLASITIPNSVTSIGAYAFKNCSSLVSIIIPDSVNNISEGAFRGCISLTSIAIPDSMNSIEHRVFSYCSSLENIVIPDSVNNIGFEAFRGCSSLTSIDIPGSITTIESGAFNDCSSLTAIIFDGDAPTIGVDSFANVASDATVFFWEDALGFSLPSWHSISSQTRISDSDADSLYDRWEYTYFGDLGQDGESDYDSDGFKNLDEYISLTDPKNEYSNQYYSLFDFSLNTDGLSYSIMEVDVLIAGNVTIPANYLGLPVTSIEDSAFLNCSFLNSVTIPSSFTSIMGNAFSNCSSLTTVNIADSVTSIGDSAFSNCNSINSITIPESVISIGDFVFKGCSSELYVILNETSDYLATEGSFADLVREVYVPEGTTSINNNAFSNLISLIKVVIPNSVISINDNAFRGCSELSNISIPDGVTYIGSGAFYGCRSLRNISIPDGVTYIGTSAFEGASNITSIEIPDGVTSIELNTFRNCSELANITIPGVISIDDNAFYGCSNLINIIIPEGVTSIGSKAFYGCNSLVSVTLPSSVNYLGEEAFNQCNYLKDITFEGPPPAFSAFNYMGWFNNNTPILYYKVNAQLWEEFRTSFSLPLVYLGPPSITVQPQDVTTTLGSPVSLLVTATDARETPLSYQWIRNGIDLENETSSVLYINSLEILDIGSYQVKVTNQYGTTMSNGTAVNFTSPVDSNGMYTQQQYDTALFSGFTSGIEYVTSNPSSYGLIAESSIADARSGSVAIRKVAETVFLQLQIERSEDLTNWTQHENDLISVPMQMNGDEQFFRFAIPQE